MQFDDYATEVCADDTTHRIAGLWALEIVNCDVWSTFIEYAWRSAADVLMGQETKVCHVWDAASFESLARSAGWNMSIALGTVTDKDGKSCGLATGCKACIRLLRPQRGIVGLFCFFPRPIRLETRWVYAFRWR